VKQGIKALCSAQGTLVANVHTLSQEGENMERERDLHAPLCDVLGRGIQFFRRAGVVSRAQSS